MSVKCPAVLGTWSLLCVLACFSCTGESPERHLEAARAALFREDPKLALDEYRRVLDLTEGQRGMEKLRTQALLGAATVYVLRLRDLSAGAEIYRELITQHPNSDEGLASMVSLAEVLETNSTDTREAVDLYARASARIAGSRGSELAFRAAKLACERKDYAICEGQAALAAKNGYPVRPAYFLQAIAFLGQSGGEYAGRVLLRRVIAMGPEDELSAQAYYELGRVDALAGNFKEAIHSWERALPLHPRPELLRNAIASAKARSQMFSRVKLGDARSAFDRNRPSKR